MLDGIDLKEYDINEIRKFYGVLFQDYVKFSDSVHNCIGFGNIEEIQNTDGIAEAAKLTGANAFIENYKDGYETNLSKMFSMMQLNHLEDSGRNLQYPELFIPMLKC